MTLWTWLLTKAIARVGTEAFAEIAGETAIQEACEVLDIPRWQQPVEALETLADESGRVYVWQVESEADRQGMLRKLDAYEDEHGEFKAIHAVITDESELYQLNKHQVEAYLS